MTPRIPVRGKHVGGARLNPKVDSYNGPVTPAGPDATAILDQLAAGDASAADRLMPLVYDEIRAIAGAMMRHERSDHTLDPTALVHEAYVRLADQNRTEWQGRAHFLSVAATVLRRVLVDHARERNAAKRGGGWQRVTLTDADASAATPLDVDVLALDDALTRLAALHERQSRVVTLRFFGGLTSIETAHVLGVARATVADDWTIARAWLSRELDPTR